MSDTLNGVLLSSKECILPECTPGVCAHPEKRCPGTCLLDYKGRMEGFGEPKVPANPPTKVN